jgi:class 3 adenylate cyclase/tetratricopeptide (TPR) repeat protein
MSGGIPRRERKVVTVVFCDLVGFTARAESMDPEDVEALLRPYHTRVREELERHGGTVEKFIGDAVMALFGAPTAHEDDPERAVRAALAIRDFAVEDGLELRVGITTGEALVSLDARPDAGEGMASGDVVNTAARLQSAAPVNGVITDETTYRATRHAIDYSDSEPVEAKGKAERISVWEALAAHSRLGVDVAHEARSGLVGRERELAVVQDAFDRARHARTPQLLTLVGVPGIGKSRLVFELSQIVDADPELITWRQGRCLAYGDGVTLWALGEIVKAQAAILEQDAPREVAEKLRVSAADVLPAADAAWVETHLLALVGLAAEAELGGDRRNEAFAAWRRYLEGLADQRPLVLVFEDLHWADESLLDFVDELVDWVTDVPLLVVATARPELLERRPGWGGGKLNATTLALAPLTDEQTAALLGRLLVNPLLEAESQQTLLERAGGNPLYAEQFAELYVERGSTKQLPLPETLQGIIAARLDGLSASEKDLVLDAAVVGKVFWAGALGRNGGEVVPTLHSLERKGFVRRQRRSSVEGESELAFAHALVRDVAYGQIPRADRAAKHRRVADWIESLGRPQDHAEMLAFHWCSALDLARASGGADDDLAERARYALRNAGDRAVALNGFAAAAGHYEDALELWPDDDERPDLLFRLARARYQANDDRREQTLETARDALLQVGQTDRAAEMEAFRAMVSWYRGQGDTTRARLTRAEELAGTSVSPSAARVLTVSARTREIAGEHRDGKRLGESALAMAENLGLDELGAHALTTIGMAKQGLGDHTGRFDIERALELALEIDSPTASGVASNLAVQFMFEGDLRRADELWTESWRLSERFGDEASLRFLIAPRLSVDYLLGRWAQALEAADTFIADCETGSPHTNEWNARTFRGAIREARGDAEGALADHTRGVAYAREIQNPLYLAETLAHCAATVAGQGDCEQALTMLDEVIRLTRKHGMVSGLAICGVFAGELGVTNELRTAIEEAPGPAFRGWHEVFLLILAGDLLGAADRFAAMGNRAFEARQRLHAGERLVDSGHRAAGEAELRRALDFYRSVEAAHFVSRAEMLLAKSA